MIEVLILRHSMKLRVIKAILSGSMVLLLSGCGTLLGSKFYDSGVSAQFYNETKHEILPYNRKVLLTDNLNGTHSLITDESDHFISVAGIPQFDKSNVDESMRPLINFLRWANAIGTDQEKQRLFYNQQPAMKKGISNFVTSPMENLHLQMCSMSVFSMKNG